MDGEPQQGYEAWQQTRPIPAVNYLTMSVSRRVKFIVPLVKYDDLRIYRPLLTCTSYCLTKVDTFHDHSFFFDQGALAEAITISVPAPPLSVASHLSLRYKSKSPNFTALGLIVFRVDWACCAGPRPQSPCRRGRLENVFRDIGGQFFLDLPPRATWLSATFLSPASKSLLASRP